MAQETTGNGLGGEGGTIYADFIRSELDAARAASMRLDQRSAFIVTTSGALISLLFGFTTIFAKESELRLTAGARYALYGALGCFAVAAVLAIVAIFPTRGLHARTDELRRRVPDHWDDPEPDAQRMVALTLLKYVDDVRRSNRRRDWLVVAGLTAEMLAVLSVAVAVLLLIQSV